MAEVKEKETFVNPYVIQMDKFCGFADASVKDISDAGGYKGTFTKDEIEEMFLKITDKVCENCEKKEWCLEKNRPMLIRCCMRFYAPWKNMERN